MEQAKVRRTKGKILMTCELAVDNTLKESNMLLEARD